MIRFSDSIGQSFMFDLGQCMFIMQNYYLFYYFYGDSILQSIFNTYLSYSIWFYDSMIRFSDSVWQSFMVHLGQCLFIVQNYCYYFNFLGEMKEMIAEVTYFVHEDFNTLTYESCKNVINSATSTLAMNMLCGPWGATFCTPERWFEYMGSITNGYSPFNILYHFARWKTNVLKIGHLMTFTINTGCPKTTELFLNSFISANT